MLHDDMMVLIVPRRQVSFTPSGRHGKVQGEMVGVFGPSSGTLRVGQLQEAVKDKIKATCITIQDLLR